MSRVLDRCPYWLYSEITKQIGQRLVQSLTQGTQRDDEVRRVKEALDWLSLKIKTEDARSGSAFNSLGG